MQFLKTPNLPQADVSLMAVSAKFNHILVKLKQFGIQVIPINPRQQLEPPIHSHADMLCHHLGKDHIVIAKGENILKLNFEKFGFHVMESITAIASPYPTDCALKQLGLAAI